MKSKPSVITLPKTYQCTCWNTNCPDYISFNFDATVERNGLRCKRCNYLNEYKWTESEYLETQKDYGQQSL